METEFKYRLNDTTVFDGIVSEMTDAFDTRGDVETIGMRATYFDTEFQDLRHHGIAYRIRHENDRVNATIKWDLDVIDGLHVREEINLVVNDENFAEKPDIELFKSSDAYEVLANATQGRELVKMIDMNFTRRQILVDTGKSLSCISEDTGTIVHVDGHDVPLMELEIEWYHGDEDDFKALAARIQEKYELQAENISKLQRAFI